MGSLRLKAHPLVKDGFISWFVVSELHYGHISLVCRCGSSVVRGGLGTLAQRFQPGLPICSSLLHGANVLRLGQGLLSCLENPHARLSLVKPRHAGETHFVGHRHCLLVVSLLFL